MIEFSSSSSSSASSHSDEDNIDIVSVTSSSDLAGSNDEEIFFKSETKQNKKLDLRNPDVIKLNQKLSSKEQNEKSGQDKTRKIL